MQTKQNNTGEPQGAENTLTLQIVRSVVGNSPVMPLGTLNQASMAYRAFIEQNGLGASEAGSCLIRQGRKVVATVSYNGKVWEGETCIFQP